MSAIPPFPIDFNTLRQGFIRTMMKVTGLSQNQIVMAEPETQNLPRPSKPYFSMKISTPAAKNGDDSKDNVLDKDGNATSVWNSGGVRQMTVSFDCYGNSHEEAYNYMGLWQTSLDLENIQQDLREYGIAVWIIGNLVDLSALLNTGYEGRSHMECNFGIAMNLQSDLGYMEVVTVKGKITTDQNTVVEPNIVVNLGV